MLQASDLTKAYDGAPLFDGLSFVLGDGERAGLVGPNGVGKSTLLKLLAGVEPPDRGAASTGPGERIGRLAQEAPDAATTLGELLGAGLGEVWTVRGELRALEARLTAGDLRPPRWSATDRRSRASRRWVAGRWRPRWTRPAARWPSTTSTPGRRWPGSRAASRRAPCWPARCWPGPRSCCSTSRPTTSTATGCAGWRSGCAASPGRSSSSRTTARSSMRSSAASSSSSPAVRSPATRAATAIIVRSARRAGEAGARLRGPGEATTTAPGGHRDHAPAGAAHRAHRQPRGGAQAQALRQEGGQEGQGARGPAAARARGRSRRRRCPPSARRRACACRTHGPRTPPRRGAERRALARRWPTSTSRCTAATASR